jgi:hypothetical protein
MLISGDQVRSFSDQAALDVPTRNSSSLAQRRRSEPSAGLTQDPDAARARSGQEQPTGGTVYAERTAAGPVVVVAEPGRPVAAKNLLTVRCERNLLCGIADERELGAAPRGGLTAARRVLT